jgi:Protein of unknown function (DUF3553)
MITPSRELVGRKVCVPAAPDWGVGNVLKVLETTVGGQPSFRVTVQFPHAIRTLVVPPAVLGEPVAEDAGPQRTQGWLESFGKGSLDARLRSVPDELARVLGSLPQRLTALLPLYRYSDEAKSLIKWARAQTGVADPLSQWNRDELGEAFRVFAIERDGHFRSLLAQLKSVEGQPAITEFLESVDPELRAAVRAAIDRPV